MGSFAVPFMRLNGWNASTCNRQCPLLSALKAAFLQHAEEETASLHPLNGPG